MPAVVFILNIMKTTAGIFNSKTTDSARTFARTSAGNAVRTFLRNFFRCGIAGWCLEVAFTSFHSLLLRDFTMMAHTSLLMFPVYGMGALLGPVGRMADRWVDEPFRILAAYKEKNEALVKLLRHGFLFMVLIFLVEYASGQLFRALGICPWDYTGMPTNVDGLIRLDFAPFWFVTGLLLEKITQKAPDESL